MKEKKESSVLTVFLTIFLFVESLIQDGSELDGQVEEERLEDKQRRR